MLKHIVDRSDIRKKISVKTCSNSLTELLQSLLEQWKFEICDTDDSEVLLLAEEGCAVPVEGQRVLWLSRTEPEDRSRFSLPLELEHLWQILERRFHQPPRMHIRMNLEINATVTVGDETVSTTLSSLSDMGGRFTYHRELVREQQLVVSLQVAEQILKINSQVIYAMPQFSVAGSDTKVGIIFQRVEKDEREMLRHFLILRYLEEVQKRMDRSRFTAALQFLALPPYVREKLTV